MSSTPPSPAADHLHVKPSFRRHSNYAAGRKYRRHSPVNGPSSSDDSPMHDHSPSQGLSREDSTKTSDRPRRKNEGRDLDRDAGRSRSDKGGGDSYRYSERPSFGSSHHHRKHDDYSRHYRCANEGERGYNRSSHSGRESRSGTRSDYRRRESEHERSRDYWPDNKELRSKDKDRDSSVPDNQKHKDAFERTISGRGRSNSSLNEIRSGERNSHKKSLGDSRDSDRFSHEGPGKDLTTTRGISGSQLREPRKSNSKELKGHDGHTVEKKKYEDGESDRHRDQYKRELDESDYRSSANLRKRDVRNEQKEDESSHVGDDRDSLTKKLKMVSSGCSSLKSTPKVDEALPSNLKQFQETVSTVSLGHSQSSTSVAEGVQDLNAAKVAAMKAAELVNLNLKGSGFMSTDQKKKLLWGNKKNSAAEESGNRWDTSSFSDKDRQEKFYKLMGVKGDAKIEHKPDGKEDSGLLQAEKQQEQLQLELEKQYTAGLRRRDGRTVGLGL